MDKLQAYVESFIASLRSTDTLYEILRKLTLFFTSFPLDDVKAILTATATSFALILVAEMGDKSQLVCMALAAKHRPLPVVFGALRAVGWAECNDAQHKRSL
jgi:putative Ca2+/H+ antiporter (TMEM165/GDT1 family)